MGNTVVLFLGHLKGHVSSFKECTRSCHRMLNLQHEFGSVSHFLQYFSVNFTENYIKYYNYAEFTNMKEINHGSVGNIFQASWKGTDTLLVVKSNKLSAKEIVNEVFFINFHK